MLASAVDAPVRWLVSALAILLLTLVAAGTVSAQDDEETSLPEFVVIINADNPTTKIERKRLSQIFQKKVKSWEDWDDGPSTDPVDHPTESPLREAFNEKVHRKSASSINAYWQRLIFSGRDAPPDVLADDASVIARVAQSGGAVGYVSAGANLGTGVKAVDIEY